MKLNWDEIINIQIHKQEIEAEAQKIKNKFVGRGTTKEYLDALSEVFLGDIRKTVSHMYQMVLTKLEKVKICEKNLAELQVYLAKGFKENFFNLYIHILSIYNFGMMFDEYHGDFQKYIDLFEKKASRVLEEECSIQSFKLKKELPKKKNFLYRLLKWVLPLIGSTIFTQILKMILNYFGFDMNRWVLGFLNKIPSKILVNHGEWIVFIVTILVVLVCWMFLSKIRWKGL